MAQASARPIITLTTDFGSSDHYSGTMKGVLLQRCPDAQIVDITHDLPPFSVLAGAYAIAQAAPFFPAGTIHVVVIDPGVGTSRRPLLVAAMRQYFIAPDNGVLTLITQQDPHFVARELAHPALGLETRSTTFHGRDLFAPAAGAVAAGTVEPASVGPVIADMVREEDLDPIELTYGRWRGRILSIDRFGNIITNLRFPDASAGRRLEIEIAGTPIRRHLQTFGQARHQELFFYLGSSGFIEVGINQMPAAHHLRVSAGDPVFLRMIHA